jgi:hypothetical protein
VQRRKKGGNIRRSFQACMHKKVFKPKSIISQQNILLSAKYWVLLSKLQGILTQGCEI